MTKRMRHALAAAALGLFLMVVGGGSAHATGADCKLDADTATLGKVKAAVTCTVTTVQNTVN